MGDATIGKVETLFAIADAELVRLLWDGYCEAHAVSEELCIQEQRCFTEETFAAAMADPEYVKFVLFVDGAPVGMIGGTNNLEKARVAYVNPKRLVAAHPPAAEGRLWYMPLLFVRDAWQGSGATRPMFAAMTRFFLEQGAAFASDFAFDKHPDFLELIAKTVGPAVADATSGTSVLRHQVLGGQTYVIWMLEPREAEEG